MVLPLSLRERFALLPRWLRDAAEAGIWLLGIVATSVLTWWLTGRPWACVTAGAIGMLLAAGRLVKTELRLRVALTESEQQRERLEQALLRSQKMEALGRLTVGVAHDFNNQLTVISSNVEMVALRLGVGQERLSRHTDAAMQGIKRAAMLTGRLLSLSRQPPVEPETVEVDRLVGGLSGLLRRTLGDRIQLEIQLSGAPWFTWADVNQMENALLSLAVNARDQVPDGGVLGIMVSNVQLDTAFVASHPSMSPGDYIEVSVSAAAATEPKRWVAADEVTNADLFIVRAFVRDVGGCLLRAAPTQGDLSLRLFLPRVVPPAVAAANLPRSQGGRTTILVVEDEASIRATCVETLRALDYAVLEAPDAMEAFRLIVDQGGIDLLFTDLGLPGGVSGRALAEAVNAVDPNMRVLFTTGYDRADLPAHAAVSLLRKPFNPAQLAAKVRDVLAAGHQADRPKVVKG